MKDKRISSLMQKSIHSLFEIIELNEDEPIIFQRDKKKKQQQLCKVANSGKSKEVVLIIPKEFPRTRINNN